jgi:hypothetical protein
MLKNLITLLVATVMALNAEAAYNPTSIKGQGDSSSVLTSNLQVPNKLSTLVAAGTNLIETGNTNILANPGLEHSTATTSWTTTNGTAAVESTIVIEGKQSLKITATAQTPTLIQDSTLYAAQFTDGVQGLAFARVKTSLSGIQVCSRSAGVTSTTSCVTHSGSGKWELLKVPFVLGGTSNGIAITSAANVTGNIYVDSAFVGAVDLKVDSSQVATQTAYLSAGTFVGNSTITGALTSSSGSSLFSYNSGTGIYTALQPINVALSFTPRSNSAATVEGQIQVNGSMKSRCNTQNSTGYNCTTTYSARLAINDTFQFFNSTNSTDANIISVLATNPVSISTYSSSCGASCVDTYSAYINSSGVVSKENVDWINGNCTYGSVAANTWGCPVQSSLGLASTLNCSAVNDTNRGVYYDVVTTTLASANFYTFNTTTNSATQIGFYVVCQKAGADFVATRTIQGSFNNVVTTAGVTAPEHFSVSYGTTNATTACTASPCSYLDQIGVAVASVTRSTTGTYAMNTVKTYSKLKCAFPSFVGSDTYVISANMQCSNCNSLSFTSQIRASAALSDTAGTLMCDGVQ